MSGSSSTHSSVEKPPDKPSSSRIASILSGSSNHGSSSNTTTANKASSLFGPLLDMKGNSNGSAPGSPDSLVAAADARALAVVVDGGGGGGVTSSKKKVKDLKLRPSGTSRTLRLKKQAQFTPSPSEFRSRERQDVVGESVLLVCFLSFACFHVLGAFYAAAEEGQRTGCIAWACVEGFLRLFFGNGRAKRSAPIQ